MSLEFWMIGKTKEVYLQSGINEYQKRSKRYLKIESQIIPDVKNASKLSVNELKKQEATSILNKLDKRDYLVLLDEKGKSYTSRKFAAFMENRLSQSMTKTIFLIGGAFGFDQSIYDRANLKLSLSEMTFSHQLIRLVFWEQLYRAIAINNNLPYHND